MFNSCLYFGIKRIYCQSGANAGSYYGHPHINCLSTLRIYAAGIRHYLGFYPLTDKKFKEIVVEIDNRKKMQQQLISDITN